MAGENIWGIAPNADPNGPALDPPPGVIPVFDDPPEIRHALGFGVAITGTALAVLSVLIRLTERAMSRKFGWADLFLILALVSVVDPQRRKRLPASDTIHHNHRASMLRYNKLCSKLPSIQG